MSCPPRCCLNSSIPSKRLGFSNAGWLVNANIWRIAKCHIIIVRIHYRADHPFTVAPQTFDCISLLIRCEACEIRCLHIKEKSVGDWKFRICKFRRGGPDCFFFGIEPVINKGIYPQNALVLKCHRHPLHAFKNVIF